MSPPAWRDVRAFVRELPDLAERVARGEPLPAHHRGVLAASPRCRALLRHAAATCEHLEALPARPAPAAMSGGDFLAGVYERAGEPARSRIEDLLLAGLANSRSCPPDVSAVADAEAPEHLARALRGIISPVQAPPALWGRVRSDFTARSGRRRFAVLRRPRLVAALAAAALVAAAILVLDPLGIRSTQNSGTSEGRIAVNPPADEIRFTYRVVESPVRADASVASMMAAVAGVR